MKAIDFLFYYLVMWFEVRQQKFKRIDPIEKTTYGLGIATILWIMCIVRTVEYFIFDNFNSFVYKYIFVVLALFFMWLYKYIYITKGRFKRVLAIYKQGFGVSDKSGIAISIIFVFLSLFIPMGIAVFLHTIND